MRELKVGDTVLYSYQFLKSINSCHTDMAHAKGVITRIVNYGGTKIADVQWDNPTMSPAVNVANLARPQTSGAMNI